MKTFDIYINPATGRYYACDKDWKMFKKDPALTRFSQNNHLRTHTIISSTRAMRRTIDQYNSNLSESVIVWHKSLYRSFTFKKNLTILK